MATTPTRRELTHERIVDTASRAIRRAGCQGVGVADIMKAAGLTHGGFYAHFESRDALVVEALDRAGRESAARMQRAIDSRVARGQTPFEALVRSYLSDRHLAEPEEGCPVAALATEMPRQAEIVREAGAVRVRLLVERVRSLLPDGVPRQQAATVAGTLVGTLQLARVLGDNAEGRAVLASARAALLGTDQPGHQIAATGGTIAAPQSEGSSRQP